MKKKKNKAIQAKLATNLYLSLYNLMELHTCDPLHFVTFCGMSVYYVLDPPILVITIFICTASFIIFRAIECFFG